MMTLVPPPAATATAPPIRLADRQDVVLIAGREGECAADAAVHDEVTRDGRVLKDDGALTGIERRLPRIIVTFRG
ncbi:MAG: hypothetical protein IT294_06405 [Deltaproteobacteria bacterium]|nr:hypothetical protein [Deltaproteobacteria bacterium]